MTTRIQKNYRLTLYVASTDSQSDCLASICSYNESRFELQCVANQHYGLQSLSQRGNEFQEKICGDGALAIKGKFIINPRFVCGVCGEAHAISARSAESTAEIRTELICPTGGCSNTLERANKSARKTNGNASNRPSVELFRFPNEDVVELEDYECNSNAINKFAQAFIDVLRQIPRNAVDAIKAHWQSGVGSPHVWVLDDRKEWNGKGWAATSPTGMSLYFVSLVVDQLCLDNLKTLIAHELGHTLFIALNEPNHVDPKVAVSAISQLSAKPDPKRLMKCEWLVWQLMDGWGFDQMSLEVHMERCFIDDASGVRLKDTFDDQAEKMVRSKKDKIQRELQGITFAEQYQQYLIHDCQRG